MVAQEIALQGRELIRRVILVGTGPRGADMVASSPPTSSQLTTRCRNICGSPYTSLAQLPVVLQDWRSSSRKLARQDRDPEVTPEAANAQLTAIGKYITPGPGVAEYPTGIRQPTLIVQGSNDEIIPTINSFICSSVSRMLS